jgi:hypothetical protein
MNSKTALKLVAAIVLVAGWCGGEALAGPPKGGNPQAAPKVSGVAKTRIGVKKANEIAVKKYKGKVVGKTALENESGSWQYAVNVRTGKVMREVMVNAYSGKIEHVEVVTAKKEAAEAKAKKPNKTKK